jgi:hypothetical protein
VVSGGLAPLIATWLLDRHGRGAVGAYMAAACALTVVATLFAPETHRPGRAEVATEALGNL